MTDHPTITRAMQYGADYPDGPTFTMPERMTPERIMRIRQTWNIAPESIAYMRQIGGCLKRPMYKSLSIEIGPITPLTEPQPLEFDVAEFRYHEFDSVDRSACFVVIECEGIVILWRLERYSLAWKP